MSRREKMEICVPGAELDVSVTQGPGTRGRCGAYAFLTNSDFRFIAPMPSILHAML